MVKKYYDSVIAMRYNFQLIVPALIIFAMSFAASKNGGMTSAQNGVTWIAFVILAVSLVFYLREKRLVSKALKKVDNIEEYEKGGMVNKSYVLSDRMLIWQNRTTILEKPTKGITHMACEEGSHGVVTIRLQSSAGDYSFPALDMDEANRFAMFLKRKNPDITFGPGIKPKGKGFLKELGSVKEEE